MITKMPVMYYNSGNPVDAAMLRADATIYLRLIAIADGKYKGTK